MLDGHWRRPIDKALAPIGAWLRRVGVSADAITAAGVVMSGLCAVAIGVGQFSLALVFLILTGLPDALDGAVAKAAGTASKRGSFLDSVSDRLSDAIIFGGLAWYYAGEGGRLVLLPFALYVAASLISYQRAKAESLGFDAKGGIMERAERFVVLAVGLLVPPLLVGVLWLMLALSLVTMVQRFLKVWRQAEQPGRPRHPHRRTRRRVSRPMTERWREQLAARRQQRLD